jgi:AraC-like DNA-binding protein
MNTSQEALGLRLAVENLFEKVCKHTPLRRHMQIVLEASEDCVQLTVGEPACANSGNGSPFVARIPTARSILRGLTTWQRKRALDFIFENLDAPITVAEIAAIAGQSESHFHRAFKHSMGTTVHQYVMFRRIELAKQLMLDTSEPLCSIAVTCGMCDQSHLTRWFTRMTGESPSRWRRARTSVIRTRVAKADRSSPRLAEDYCKR